MEDDVVVEVLEVVAAGVEAEVEEGEVEVEADQEIGPAKTAVTPTLPGGEQNQLHDLVLAQNHITHCLL